AKITFSGVCSGAIRHPTPFTSNMKVTEQNVAYVGDLANLELTTDERTRLVRDLNSILEYVDRLSELNTDKIEPMTQVSPLSAVDASEPSNNQFADGSREDILNGLRKSLPHEEALVNAPESDGNYFRVPKVIER